MTKQYFIPANLWPQVEVVEAAADQAVSPGRANEWYAIAGVAAATTLTTAAPNYTVTLEAISEGQTVGFPDSGANVIPSLTGNAGSPPGTFTWSATVNGAAATLPITAVAGTQIVLTYSDPNHPLGAYSASSSPVTVTGAATETDFIMTVETTTANEPFELTLWNLGTYNATVDWGDGTSSTVTAYNDADLVHTYAVAGTHTIRMSGQVSGIRMSSSPHKAKVRTVENVGDLGWHGQGLMSAFSGCTGLTAFTAGNTGSSAFTILYNALAGCKSLVTADISGIDFSTVNNIQLMFAGTSALTTLTGSANLNDAPLLRGDEFLHETNAAFDASQLQIGSLNLTNLNTLAAGGSLFNFLNDTAALSQAVYDALLVHLDANRPPDGAFLAFGDSPYTTGGAAETARTNLINAGISIEDIGNAPPELPTAPTAESASATEITVTLSADPFTNGLPISSRDIRYSTDQTNWTILTGISSPYTITGLTKNQLYYIQWRAVNYDGAGTWSPAAQATSESVTASFDVTEDGNEPIFMVTGDGDLTVEITSGTYMGVYSTNAATGQPLTVAMIQAAATPLVLPSQTGPAIIGSEQTGIPGFWLYDGEFPGVSSFEWFFNGVATGDIDLAYTPNDIAETPGLVLRETFGGVIVDGNAVVIGSAANAPEPFVDVNWSVTTGPITTPNSLTLDIAALPLDNGLSITDVQYRVDDLGSWISIPGYAGVDAYDISLPEPETNYSLSLRAINSDGPGAPGNSERATSGAGVPEQITAFTLTQGSSAAEIDITIDAAPLDNGSAITDYEYQIGTGSWTSLGTASIATTVTVLAAAASTSYDIRVRAVNAVGAGVASVPDPVTSGDPFVITNPSVDDAGLYDWFDASDVAKVTVEASTTNVTRITSKTSTRFMDGGGNPKPQYNPATIQQKGMPCIQTSGSNNMFQWNWNVPAGDFTIHGVNVIEGPIDNFHDGIFGLKDNLVEFSIVAGSSTEFKPRFAGVGHAQVEATGGPYTGMITWSIIVDYTNSVTELWINGEKRVSTALSGTSDLVASLLWGINGSGNRPFPQKLCELLFTNSMDKQFAYHQYLNQKWSA